jgi:predicted transcriptional regulator
MAVQQEEMHGQVTSVRLPADLRDRLDELARITGRPRNELVVEALTYYVDRGMEYLAEVALARRDVAEGRTVTTDELNARLRERGFLGGA